MRQWIRMNAKDNVATALIDLPEGTRVDVDGESVTIEQPIPFGHKFAVRYISQGEDVIKYGQVIGRATANISTGCHAHVHNVESLRGRGDLAAQTGGDAK